ncbi:protein rotatin homolog [Anastrepha obliqua]|uniref:protein rotatin homolog n=1 Tax=Anastrepha obliqua TaxID=95512 RepID=UPI00240A138B|nr:protein rotatin homolog [Anastrepha obliqua]XP_054744876.1 protein rotatin homolog [Anastrepha obliqua]
MSLQLDHATVRKLSHESSEIRLRTLEQIWNKLSRALEHNEQLQFKAGDLCKQLIRWFGFQPLCAVSRVLKLLLLILRSNYSEEAIQQLGVERFKKEIEKVKLLLKKHPTESQAVDEINRLLSEYQENQMKDETDKVTEAFNLLSLPATGEVGCAKYEKLISHFEPTDFEQVWSKPTPADFTALSFIADLLTTDIGKVEMRNALLHLEITMQDYPAEYMLQAPHVFLALMHLFRFDDDIESKSVLEDVARPINAYLKLLLARLKLRCNVSAYSIDTTISKTLGNTQLKISTVLREVFEKGVKLLEICVREFRKEARQIFEILNNCMELYRNQRLLIDAYILKKLNKIILNFQVCFEKDEHFTLQRINCLLIICLLDDALLHNSKMQSYKDDSQMLEFLLRDYTFKENFPQRYKNIQLRVQKNVGRYQKLERYDNCFRAAVSLLQHPQDFESARIIINGPDICIALENLKSVKLVEHIISAIIDCNALYVSQPELRAKANHLLILLLRLKHEPLRTYVYKMLAMAIKRHFACLMESERYCIGLTHEQLLDSQVLGIPLSSEFLLNLIYECGEGARESIRKISEDILMLILKSQNLVGEYWAKYVELLLPVLSLLQCCTKSPQIIKLLQNLLDPDSKQLPFLAVLQGNITFMFYHDSTVRNEALTRLIYMMNSVPEAEKYVPNLLYISDIIPNDLCILKKPRVYQGIFVDATDFCERETLHNLLSLLEMPDVDPVIRKTTLMQLNVMCQQWHNLAAFCEESAHYLILRALENSLLAASYEDYTGAAIPAIGVLCKVLLYDAAVRRELSETPNMYVLLLRALCLYQNDIQLRQDACICLFLLLYANFLVVLGNQRVEAPRLLSHLEIPLNCEFQSFEQGSISFAEYNSVFESKLEETLYVRHLLAHSFCDKQIPIPKLYLQQQKSYDFDVDLQLTLRDWRLMNATIPKQNIQRFLRAMFNATNHESLMNASVSLQLQLLVRDQQSGTAATLMPDKLATELYSLIGKYLQLPPGNECDFDLFEELLDLCDLCVRLPLPAVSICLMEELIADFQHAMIALLKNTDLSLRLNWKLCTLLGNVVRAVKSVNSRDKGDVRIFHSNLFELIFQLITQYFQKRDLHRVRCLLHLQKVLSAFDIDVLDEQLLGYCRRFIKLSLALRSSTYTGAQWQIDCLTIVCQLYAQMEQPTHNFKLSDCTVKYLSGLCGHCNRQVRALAWCILTYLSRYEERNDVRKSLTSGIDFIEKTLSYLPGGFMACCLCTFLDIGETNVVRQLAANLFTKFLSDNGKYNDAYELLTRHRFLPTADEAVRGTCVFEEQLPTQIDSNSVISITSCELISLFCRICLRMLQINADFATDLCASDFMIRLYELLKVPSAQSNPAYYTMCGDLCHLYGSCYSVNFVFLQRTLCRDHAWLMHFYQLLDQPLASDSVIVNVLQLLLVICKDNLAYEKLCQKIAKAPEFLVKHFLRAFNVGNVDTPLQRCSLAALSLLLIKSQNKLPKHDERKTFLTVLEDHIEIRDSTIIKEGRIACKTTNMDEIVSNRQCGDMSRDSSAYKIAPVDNEKIEDIAMAGSTSSLPGVVRKSAAAFIFVELFRLFQHLYTVPACKFNTAPSKAQVQVGETLGVLLGLSPEARLAANGLKLFDKITQIFTTFFEQFKCTATTYVRRYGESKKVALIKNFQLLLNIHLHWFAAPDAALTDNSQSVALSKLTMQLWPWLPYSCELKELVLQVCTYHSEHSFVVCQQFSSLFSGYAHSLLQLVIKLVVAETTKLKANKADDFPVISTGLRVVMNCCSCADGRITIIKAHMLDMFDGLHPFHLKSPKVKAEILRSWLQFWELFSRYQEGAQVRNLRALCDVISRTSTQSATRVILLRILRNMCFLPSNRSAIMNSADFICVVDTIVAHPLDSKSTSNAVLECASYEEQLIVCVGVWKLASAGVKYVALLRSTTLARHLRQLHEQLAALKDTDSKKFSSISFANDLLYVLDVVLNIFNN